MQEGTEKTTLKEPLIMLDDEQANDEIVEPVTEIKDEQLQEIVETEKPKRKRGRPKKEEKEEEKKDQIPFDLLIEDNISKMILNLYITKVLKSDIEANKNEIESFKIALSKVIAKYGNTLLNKYPEEFNLLLCISLITIARIKL